MKYELVQQLYKAGFPVIEHDMDNVNKDYPTHITLSELIEECGKDFFDLVRLTDHWEARSKFLGGNRSFGDTPDEVVAKLWLKLNK